jgi:hypothetical protein
MFSSVGITWEVTIYVPQTFKTLQVLENYEAMLSENT